MVNYLDVLFYSVLAAALLVMLFTFGALIISERGAVFSNKKDNVEINLKELKEYFELQGFTVKYTCPISNSNNWFAILQKNGHVQFTVVSKNAGKFHLDTDY
jgi:hypothetical protein